MKSISIIIPIHNRILLTQKGLRSLYSSLNRYNLTVNRQFSFSIVVVDDGSTDGSSEWISKNYPAIHILKGDGNLWWTGSINVGSRYAVEQLKADCVILWNDDTSCDLNYFTELSTLLSTNKKYQESILVAKIYWQDESDTLFNFGCYYSHRTGKKKVIGLNQKDSGQFAQITPVDWSGGMGTVIPSKVLLELNYFDDNEFPQYHGDIDFFLRAGKKGYKSYAIPTLKLYNNRDSTGISKTRTWAELKKLLTSNRSNYNIKQNFFFTKRHANTLFSWILFTGRYFILTTQSLRTIVWS